jgi:hypothetical protein
MNDKIQTDWRQLCLRASTETDPVKLLSLVEEMLQSFEDIDQSHRGEVGKLNPTNDVRQ